MKIATIASGTSTLVNKQIESRVQKLLFSISLNSALPSTNMAEIKAAFAALTVGTFVTLMHQGKNTITPHNRLDLAKIAELSTNNGGVIRLVTDGTTITVQFTIELSNTGAHPFNDNRSLVLNVEGKVNLATMDIYAMDCPLTATDYLVYEDRALEAGVEKEIDVRMKDTISIPVDTISAVEIHYKNGNNVRLTQEEVKQQLFDAEDPCISASGKTYYGYMNYAVINTELAHKVKVTLTAAGNITTTRTAVLV